MILIIILSFIICAAGGIGSLKYMERQERNALRLLAEMEIKRAEKLRLEKLTYYEDQIKQYEDERRMIIKLLEHARNENYRQMNEKSYKKVLTYKQRLHTIDNKILSLYEKIDSLE